MGYIRHHITFITSFEKDTIEVCREKAVEIFGSQVSSIVEGTVNEYYSFFIGPDGAKEGWPKSDEGDKKTSRFEDWLQREYDKGHWVITEGATVYYDEENNVSVRPILK